MAAIMDDFSFPQLLERSGSNVVIISTPGSCPRPGSSGAPYDFPCMTALEHVSGLLSPVMIPGYDFAGSASARDCKMQTPDVNMTGSDWANHDTIAGSQWARYWMGCVRGCLKTALMTAPVFKDPDEVGYWAEDCKAVFAVSISGGPITQTEKKLIPGVISGVLSDLATRNVGQAKYTIFWVHFESYADFAKALSGYGKLDYQQYVKWRCLSGLPCEWLDGPAAEGGARPAFFDRFEGDALCQCSSAKALHEYLIRRPPETTAEFKLECAVCSGDAVLVQMLLDSGAKPNFTMQTTTYESTLVDWAVEEVGRPDIVRMLLKAGGQTGIRDGFRNNNRWYQAVGEEVDAQYSEMVSVLKEYGDGGKSVSI